MNNIDEWGRDPSVRAMRKVFKAMEKSRAQILEHLQISPYDPRIRNWMENALIEFEKAWGRAIHVGVTMDEEKAAALYVHCLARGMGSGEKVIPQDILPSGEGIEKLMSEISK